MKLKLSEAIKKEFEAPYPDPRTALRYFQKRYAVEQNCPRGAWMVDLNEPLAKCTTGRADQIFNKYR